MRMNVQPIPTLSERTNEIRRLTAMIVNKEILPNENQLWPWRTNGRLSEGEAQEANCGRRSKRKSSKRGCGRRTYLRSTVAPGWAFSIMPI